MHPLQTLEWEKARHEMGIETIRINGYLLTLHQIPYTKYKIGYLPRTNKLNSKVIKELFEYGKENDLIFIKIEPYVEKSKLKTLELKKPLVVKSTHPLFPSWTQILDLNMNEDELLKSFHSKTRYNIKYAIKKGIVIKEKSDDKGFETFSKLYFETTKRQKYLGHDLKYHKIVWDNLKNNIAHILTAYYNDIPLASYQLWYKDEVIYYVYGGTSDKFRNLMASNLLMWEAIKLGIRLGAKKFDMWGSLPPNYDQSHSWSGFTRFKQGYNTKFIEMIGSYDLVVNPALYKIYNLVYSLRELYLKLKT